MRRSLANKIKKTLMKASAGNGLDYENAESSVGYLHGWRCAIACPLLACTCGFGRWQRSRVQAKSEYKHKHDYPCLARSRPWARPMSPRTARSARPARPGEF